MKRREFIKNMGLVTGAGIATLSISGIPIKAFTKPFMKMNSINGKILIIIQFKGGNDGLNTVIPVDQYGLYQAARPTIGISQNSIVSLTNATGLHPSLQPLKALFDSGKMTLLQNVGYPNQNRSHFRSTDIWLSASDADKPSYDGWIGRYLPNVFPTYPNIPPAFPMAIQLGSTQSLLFENQQYNGLGISFQTPNAFYQLVQGSSADNDPPPDTLAGHELQFLKDVENLSIEYSAVIRDTANKGNHTSDYPTDNNLAQQFNIIANLIVGGLATPVYLVTLDGFDTHADQETAARHPKLLSDFAGAVTAFQNDIQSHGLADKIIIMTFSEFGRRVKENVSKGTDHGAALPIFVFGNNVQGGILGPNASLNSLDSNGDIKFGFDFRQVYATMLIDHLGMTSDQVQSVLGNNFQTLPILKSASTGIENYSEIPKDYSLQQNYPNPFNPTTKIQYTIPTPQNVNLKIYDMLGRNVSTLVDSYQAAGSYIVNFDGSQFASGTYFYALELNTEKIVKKMVLIK